MKMLAGCQVINNITSCVEASRPLGVMDDRVESVCVQGPSKKLFQAISFFIFLFGAFGNFAYLAVTTRSYQELNIVDLYLVGLAAIDFFASIFLPLFYFLEISDYLNNSTDSSCKFLAIMHEISVVTTIFLMLFAVHAFYKNVVLRRIDGSRKIRFTVVLIFSILISVIPAIPIIVDSHSVDGVCHVKISSFSYAVIYDVVLFLFQAIIPLLLFTIMFSQLGVHLHWSRNAEEDDEMNVAVIDHTVNTRKLVLLIIITCTFFLLFLPYVIANLWFLMDEGRILEDDFYCYLFDIFHLLICGKCLANPIIYIVYLEGFRENLKRVICGFRIGRRYNFMHIKYHFRRDTQDGVMEEERVQMEEGHMLDEMNDWQAQRPTTPPQPDPDLALDDKEYDYEEEDVDNGGDNIAILKPWKNLRSTSTF